MFPVDKLSQRPFPQLHDFRLYLPNATFANPAWEKASPHILILRLSTFSDVERSIPHLFLAGEVRRGCALAYVDMAFLPRPDDARLMEDAGLPLILGTQSHRPLGDFDLVLISNSHLLELVNLPFLFSHSGVPLWSSQRGEQWPAVILGGSNASAAHALVSDNGDCIVDAIFFGEGEAAVARIAAELPRLGGFSRSARLAKLAEETDGLWAVGGGAQEIRRARCDVAAATAGPLFQPVLPGPEATTVRLSITLGCPCLCSFCYEGHDRRPFREVPADALVATARKLKTETGAATIELSSFNFNTHSELAKLLIALNRLFLRVNLMSQRVDILAQTRGLLELELAADKRSFTLGIEGISSRQRRFLHKSLADSDIERALEALHGSRIREVKLFYILTGGEAEEDFTELAGFAKWLKGMRRRFDAPPRIVFSFGMLVRMPFTPLRYDPPVLPESAWRPLAGRAKSICETNGFEFRLSTQWPEYAATQVLALSHHSPADLLVGLSDKGCVLEDLPSGAKDDVEEWLRKAGSWENGDQQASGFAFSFLETENSRKALLRQYLAAKAGRDAGYASGPVSSNPNVIPAQSVRELAELTQAKHRLSPVFREALFPRETAGMGVEWKESWIMRRLLALCPGQIDNMLSIRESLLERSGVFGADAAWFGKSVVAVTAWDQESFAQAVVGLPELFGAVIHGFTPGSLTRVDLSLFLSTQHFPDTVDRLATFLKDSHAPVTVKREGGAFDLIVPDKSARRKVIYRARGVRSDDGVLLSLTIGAKFDLGRFLSSFADPSASSTDLSGRRSAVVEVLRVT